MLSHACQLLVRAAGRDDARAERDGELQREASIRRPCPGPARRRAGSTARWPLTAIHAVRPAVGSVGAFFVAEALAAPARRRCRRARRSRRARRPPMRHASLLDACRCSAARRSSSGSTGSSPRSPGRTSFTSLPTATTSPAASDATHQAGTSPASRREHLEIAAIERYRTHVHQHLVGRPSAGTGASMSFHR